MKNAGKARSYGLYRHLRTSKEIIENLLNYYCKLKTFTPKRKRECPFKNGHFILSLHNSQCFFREAVKQKKKRQRSSKATLS